MTIFLILLSSIHAIEKPNIVLILADDLGYGDLKSTNPDCKNSAPAIDRIAEEGVVFTDMHSAASWCVPSRYGLMTATYPHKNNRKYRTKPVIADNELTLPEMLKRNGYRTAMIGKWHLGFETKMNFHVDKLPGGPYDRGFDYFYRLPHSLDIQPYLYIENDRPVQKPTEPISNRGPSEKFWNEIQGEFWREGKCAPNFKHEEVLDILTDKSIDFIKSHPNESQQPLFLFIPLTAPHTPWLPAERFRKNSPNGIYGAFVAHIDDCVNRIDQAIKNVGIEENTIIIITSDNGPVWYEKDEERTRHKSRGTLRGMKGDVYEGGHRVPFIMRWPKYIQAGSHNKKLSSFLDVMPTLAEIIGDKKVPAQYIDGISLGKTFTESKRDELIHLGTKKFLAIRYKNWKYIPFIGSGGFSHPKITTPQTGEAKGQLYNLKIDPGETENLYKRYPELVEKLASKLDELKNK
ncbi:MAG: arylsulfatase [Lentisphaerales bacterium]|nr:arylsulfatase [Lentisphaerales bacterium]